MTHAIIDAALRLHNRGCWIVVSLDPRHELGNCTVPRKKPCQSPGKAPIHTNWQLKRLDAVQITRFLNEHPGLNIGIRWGPESGLIDVEADSPEAETALQELFNDAG